MSRRILLISPIPTHPQTAGNRTRVYSLAIAIRQLGHELHFAHVQREKGDLGAMVEYWGEHFLFPIPYTRPRTAAFRIRKKIRSLFNDEFKLITYVDAWYDDSINDHLKRLHRRHQYDMVIVEYVFFSKALACFPNNVLKAVDTHDVMTNRHHLYLQNNYPYNWFSTTAAQEKKGLKRADVIIAIQDRECAFFSQLTGKKSVTVGHYVALKKQGPVCSSNRDLLFVGSANQSNIDAIEFFIADIFPIIKAECPHVTLKVAGAVCRVLESDGDGVVKLGMPESLEAVYAETAVVINPIRFGTGLKIKNIEALGYSKPLVTTSVGAEGMEEGIRSAFLVADDARNFADAVIHILKDPTLIERLTENGYEFASAWNRRQSISLQEVLRFDRKTPTEGWRKWLSPE